MYLTKPYTIKTNGGIGVYFQFSHDIFWNWVV
jgi:hypothetical protein